MSPSTVTRHQRMWRVIWYEAGPKVVERVLSFRARRSEWDCLPLDTFEDEQRAALEGWHPSRREAIEAERASALETAERYVRRAEAMERLL